MNNRAKLKFIQVKKIVSSLNEAIELVAENTEAKFEKGLKDSVIQRFEYSVEGIRKLLKYYLLEESGENILTPKESIKSAYKVGIIEDMGVFIDMIDKRNRLSHDYHEEFAEISFELIVNKYLDPINELIVKLKNKVG